LKFEGKLTNDHKEIADTFNKHFISVAGNIITKNNHNDSSINNMDNFFSFIYFHSVDPYEV